MIQDLIKEYVCNLCRKFEDTLSPSFFDEHIIVVFGIWKTPRRIFTCRIRNY